MRHGTALEKRVQRHKRGERMTMMLSSPFLPWLWLSHTLQKAKSNQVKLLETDQIEQLRGKGAKKCYIDGNY